MQPNPLVGNAPDFGAMPEFLKIRPYWACYNLEPKGGGKTNKIPCDARTRRFLRANHPEDWCPFDECRAAVEAGKFHGVGILLNGDGLVGIDVDNVRAAVEQFSGLRQLIAEARRQGLYVELSPSRTGVHILCHGDIGTSGARKSLDGCGVEVYARDRFLTVTGWRC